MSPEKQAEASVDTAQPKSTEQGEAQEEVKSILQEQREAIEDKLIPSEPKEETSEPLAETEEAETPASEDTPPPADKQSDETDEPDSLTEFVGEPEGDDTVKRDGRDKRIDKLTAEKYQLQAELHKLKSQEDKGEKDTSSSKERIYTDAELDTAERNAHKDGDSDLLVQISKERFKNAKRELRIEYQGELKRKEEDSVRATREWQQVRNSYDYLAAPNAPEIYPGARNELDINSQNSNLVRLAKMLYASSEEELEKIFGYTKNYRRPGGQELAVSDALNLILKKRRGQKSDNKETKKLKKALVKEKRKRSLGSPGAEKEEVDSTPKRPRSTKETLEDEISSRRKLQSERSGALG